MTPTTQRPYLLLFFILALAGFLADQVSKYSIFSYLYTEELLASPPHITIVPGCFQMEASHTHLAPDLANAFHNPGPKLVLHRNPPGHPLTFLRTISGECLPHVNRGALFGIGNGTSDGSGMNMLFALISVIAAGFIIIWANRPAVAKDRLMCIALGLILAGTLGNLYDRLVFDGVRDFLHWYYWYDWPVFNIADCCLVCGATGLMLHSLLIGEQPEAAPGAPAEVQTAAVPDGAFSERPQVLSSTAITTSPPDGV